jgi:mannose-6-phosphate isomerase-like protein (cupin superfamily)
MKPARQIFGLLKEFQLIGKATSLKTPFFDIDSQLEWVQIFPGESCVRRVHSDMTNKQFSVTEALVDSQVGPPLHIHTDADEWLYIIEGTLDVVCDGERNTLKNGDMVAIPRGVRHTFRNFSDSPVRILGILSPAGFEELLFAMQGRSPDDFANLAPSYGLEIVGPPLGETGTSNQYGKPGQ